MLMYTDIKKMSGEFEASWEGPKQIYGIKDDILGCLYHYLWCIMKYLRKCALSNLYRSRKYVEFNVQINIYCLSVFLESDEIESFCKQQECYVQASIPSNEKKKLRLLRFFKYHVQWWQKKNKHKVNFFDRYIDLTNNIMEVFNRWFNDGTINIFKLLTKLQRIFALSNLKFRKLEHYQLNSKLFDPKSVFSKAKKSEREAKIHLKKVKLDYANTSKNDRTFDIQKNLLKNVYYIIKHRFDEVEEFSSDNVDESDHIQDLLHQILDVNANMQLLIQFETKYNLSKYPNTNAMNIFLQDVTNDDSCKNLFTELNDSIFWTNIVTKWDLKNKLALSQQNNQNLTKITEKLNDSIRGEPKTASYKICDFFTPPLPARRLLFVKM